MAFETITTQEQFDEMVKDRLARAEEKYAKRYEGFVSADDVEKIKADYEKQISDLNGAIDAASKKAAKYDTDIAERDAKIKNYETASVKTRIAHEAGLSYDAIEFLRGEDEESIKKSAEGLKALLGTSAGTKQPLASAESGASKPTAKNEFKNWFSENFKGE